MPANPFHKLPPAVQKLGWFIMIWLASVLALGAVAGLLHLCMYALGMRST